MWAGATGALYLQKITDQRLEGRPGWEPSKLADAKGREALSCHPARPY
jgi:hypothetical protein